MRLILMILIASSLTGCASFSHNDRSADRIAKACAYNLLTRWMGSGPHSPVVQGDLKKAFDAVAAANLYACVCSETAETIKEDL